MIIKKNVNLYYVEFYTDILGNFAIFFGVILNILDEIIYFLLLVVYHRRLRSVKYKIKIKNEIP